MTQQDHTNSGDNSKKRVVSVVLALASLLLFLALVFDDIGELAEADWSNLPVGLILRYAFAMGLGGALAGYLLSGLFGRPGGGGWLIALIGGFLVSTFAGLLGSAFGRAPDLLADGFQSSDLIAIVAGILVLPLSMAGWPILLPIWIALVFVAHILAKR